MSIVTKVPRSQIQKYLNSKADNIERVIMQKVERLVKLRCFYTEFNLINVNNLKYFVYLLPMYKNLF